MSATITLTMSQTSGIQAACPNCGMALPHNNSEIAIDAQKQIEELQAQVKLLTEKATAAVDKWADYEDEIQSLKKAQSQQIPEPPRATTPTQGLTEDRAGSPSRFSYLPVQNRLSSLLSRKSTPNLQAQPPPTPKTPSTTELIAALTREQGLRQAAEGKLNASSVELEELTAQLFTQANEMVATERRARAKLEERVGVLERRDVEKGKRLERLEGAVQRIERVRGLLAPER
ncbi:a208e3fa-c8c4-4141-8a1a-ee4716d3a15b [Sclerotinia trifoliorum]|uniref:A208e3fa-c8c4-4141-8a1a-ee4716d3a15b n=1 Tax=Sclerotinia trifoliorum TaxID=28548 RepID=A0A8H2ZRQ2_9HELO|nr:a208e3fa-c8c4-4141-8a1a-ee4716d3a15b [Sclerotinia trifoliorum]